MTIETKLIFSFEEMEDHEGYERELIVRERMVLYTHDRYAAFQILGFDEEPNFHQMQYWVHVRFIPMNVYSVDRSRML